MVRRLFTAASVLSLVLCVGVGVLWVVTLRWHDDLLVSDNYHDATGFPVTRWLFYVSVNRGLITLMHEPASGWKTQAASFAPLTPGGIRVEHHTQTPMFAEWGPGTQAGFGYWDELSVKQYASFPMYIVDAPMYALMVLTFDPAAGVVDPKEATKAANVRGPVPRLRLRLAGQHRPLPECGTPIPNAVPVKIPTISN